MTDALKSRIRHVPDFPKAGILFYDVTTLLRDPEGFRLAIDGITAPFTGGEPRTKRWRTSARLIQDERWSSSSVVKKPSKRRLERRRWKSFLSSVLGGWGLIGGADSSPHSSPKF